MDCSALVCGLEFSDACGAAMIITLVITMVVGGHDVERHQPMASVEQCWVEAAKVMDEMRFRHVGAGISKIGIGCVVSEGEPA